MVKVVEATGQKITDLIRVICQARQRMVVQYAIAGANNGQLSELTMLQRTSLAFTLSTAMVQLIYIRFSA